MDGTWLFLIVIAAIGVAGFAKRLSLQAPLVLVAVGSAASFIPGLPHIQLAPDLILGVVLPPLLYSAALDFSYVTFRRNLVPIIRLGVGMVVVSTLAAGFFANWLVPELTLGAAFVLGAIVAPPDAVAAVSVGRQLGLPARMMAILTGESLVNDAAALTLFTLTTAAVTGTKMSINSPIVYFLYEIAGGILVGFILAWLVRFVRSRIEDSPLETVLGLVLPFAAYLVADELHASGVLAVVTAGFMLGRISADVSIATRLQERQVWPTLDLLLETFVFAYMGLQLKFVIDEVGRDGLPVLHIFIYAALILVVVMLVRPAWIFLDSGRREIARRVIKRYRPATNDYDGATWRQNLVISWAGMRGVVTLAAASGVPLTTSLGNAFPGRAIIQAVAYVVAVGTLLIQGLTLPLLIRRLDVADPMEEERLMGQIVLARSISKGAAEQWLTAALDKNVAGLEHEQLARVIERVGRSVRAQITADETEDSEERVAAYEKAGAVFDSMRRAVLGAQRKALIDARDAGELDEEVLKTVLDGLDVEEAAAESRVERRKRRQKYLAAHE